MKDSLRFRLLGVATRHSLVALVAGAYELKEEELVDGAVAFYDMFDWRLFRKSLVLCRIGGELVVRHLAKGGDRGQHQGY